MTGNAPWQYNIQRKALERVSTVCNKYEDSRTPLLHFYLFLSYRYLKYHYGPSNWLDFLLWWSHQFQTRVMIPFQHHPGVCKFNHWCSLPSNPVIGQGFTKISHHSPQEVLLFVHPCHTLTEGLSGCSSAHPPAWRLRGWMYQMLLENSSLQQPLTLLLQKGRVQWSNPTS